MQLLRIGLVILLLCSCSPALIVSDKQDLSYEEFFKLPLSESTNVFSSYSLNIQYEIYMAGMKRHPPRQHLAFEIARKGKSVVPYLLEKLGNEATDTSKYNIIFIFQVMKENGHYDLNNEPKDIEIVENVVATMKYEVVRDRSNQSLNIIKTKI